jgi:hypothetical protein
MPKRISSILLYAVVIATVILFAYSGASAKVCLFKIGGTCVFWSGSVKGVLSASVPENLKERPVSLGFRIDAKRGLPGLAYCQHPETKGIKIIQDVSIVPKGLFEASERIMEGDIYECEGNRGAIVAPVARLNNIQLSSLDKFCGDPDLKAIDFVPRIFETTIFLKDLRTGNDIETLTVTCELPNQDLKPLGWDEINQRPEKRQYECYKSDSK